jgi:transcriptional regulator with XRE-family HTH domain
MRFKARLEAAFLRRKRVNSSYSLRAFARTLRIDHATLSQLLRERRRATLRTIRSYGPRLGLSAAEIAQACELENEAAVLAALDQTRFRADSRWLAVTLNIPLDDVNVALHSLLRKRLLQMSSKHEWQHGEGHG